MSLEKFPKNKKLYSMGAVGLALGSEITVAAAAGWWLGGFLPFGVLGSLAGMVVFFGVAIFHVLRVVKKLSQKD